MSLSLLDAARDEPDRIALVLAGRSLSFSEVAAGARRASAWIDAVGAGDPEDRRPVGLDAAPERTALELLYALVGASIPVLPLDPRLTRREREAILAACRPRMVAHPRWSDDAPPDGAALAARAAEDDPERPLAVVMTSGSSGRPRGVVLSRRAFRASAAASAENLGWREDDRWLLSLPFAHVGGLSILVRCLLARRAVVVPEAAGLSAGALDALIGAVERDRVTLASLVPAQLDALLAREPRWDPPPHLRAVLVGGAAASRALLARAIERRWPVRATYGLTEACSQVATWSDQDARGPLPPEHVGRPLPGIELRTVGEALELRGPTLLSAYCPADASAPLSADGWLATGDAARLDDAGRLVVLGRLDDVIVTGGENVHPREVERALESCPGVARACVFGVADRRWGRIVAAAVVPEAPAALPLAALAGHVERELAAFKRPRLLAAMEALPLAASGKLDRAAAARRARPHLRGFPPD